MAINHFDFEARENGKILKFNISNPNIVLLGDNYDYIASYEF